MKPDSAADSTSRRYSSFDEWNPRDYLHDYHGGFLTPDERALIQFVREYLKSRGRIYSRALEVGCGPTIHLAALAAFGGHAVAARTLVAAVHEYGLHDPDSGVQKTHFDLYRDAIRSFGFDEIEILADKSVFPEALEMAVFNEKMAQSGPLAKALGCHVALEETADREFLLLWEGFSKYWQDYNLTGTDDPALGFYHIHIVQEPIHGEMSREAITRYLELVPDDEPLIAEGVAEYLAVYQQMLEAFRHHFFRNGAH